MARPVVALLTDFGLRDHYVGAMKGVVLSVCPDASLVDITHDIPPQDVMAGSLELAAAFEYFPPATVFLAVVDPGVGSSRRAIAAEASGYFFVAPDNGVLSAVFRACAPSMVVELRNARYARSTISRTFEGRDRFAPAAGWIARRTALPELGPAVTDHVALTFPAADVTPSAVRGEVTRVDRFGNLISNIRAELLAHLPRPLVVDAAGACGVRVVQTYADVTAGEVCALVGSSGYLEIAVSGGDASRTLAAGRGTAVVVKGL